jgi:hypothetical protein
MTESYEDHERQARAIREENIVLLSEFEAVLKAAGLAQKTIRRHLSNVDFYINDYLLYDGLNHARDGVTSVHGFFDWFFPKKAMWSSPEATRENAASLKKFYRFMLETGRMDVVDYAFLLQAVKEEMPNWLAQYGGEHGW